MHVSRAEFFHPSARMDERAFESLFSELYPRLYAVLFRLTGDPDEADDLAAEAFWRLWERPPEKIENAAGWLYRVATRLGYNALRAGRRRSAYETASGGPPADPDPARAAEQRQERERVRQVLRQMPLRDVQLLVLHHSGLSYKEIAAATTVAAGSIGTLLTRAENKFEALYRQGEKDAPER